MTTTTTSTSAIMAVPTPMSGVEPFGRYILYPPIARGGMATVHPARQVGDAGFSRLVAVKRLHPQFIDDPEFVAMFHDEAHIASMIHHPNVVPVLDVVVSEKEVILVQEYVHGVPLNQLLKAAQLSGSPISVDVAVAILAGVLEGLHAAHELKDELGEPLDVVHRDVSPQNVIVSIDGVPRLLDFGIAKARSCSHHTREGVFKGKLAYMAPEQIKMEAISRRADVYAAGVLAWELFANRRFYRGESDIDFVSSIIKGAMPTISQVLLEGPAWVLEDRADAVTSLDPVVVRALKPNAAERFATALEMRDALLAAHPAASASDVAEWVRIAGAELLEQRKKLLASTSMDESSRSHSRIAAATRTAPMRSSQPPTMPTPSSSMALPIGTPLPISGPALIGVRPPQRSFGAIGGAVPRGALLGMCAGLLLIVGVLAGVLFVRGRDENKRVPQTVREEPPITIVPTLTSAEPRPDAIILPTPTLRPAKTSETVSAPVVQTPPPRWTPPPRAPAPPPPQAVAPAPAPPPQTAAPAAKVDCNPPFYFEGSKKVFKPSCL
ncbi:MAG: serine/threonine-protein kinase [Rubrivivax sp.]